MDDVQPGLSPNQTALNIDGGSEPMAEYSMNPEAFPYASVGARMYLSRVVDGETLAAPPVCAVLPR